jgi:hypothetical protein
MFETDFPHPTCLCPNALDHAARTLEGLSFEDKRKVLGGERQGRTRFQSEATRRRVFAERR